VTIQDTKRSGGTSTQRPPPAAGFFTTLCPITFPGESEPDQVDAWISAYAEPFYIRS